MLYSILRLVQVNPYIPSLALQPTKRERPKLPSGEQLWMVFFTPECWMSERRMVNIISIFPIELVWIEFLFSPPLFKHYSKRRCCWMLWAGLFTIPQKKKNIPKKRAWSSNSVQGRISIPSFTHWLGTCIVLIPLSLIPFPFSVADTFVFEKPDTSADQVDWFRLILFQSSFKSRHRIWPAL